MQNPQTISIATLEERSSILLKTFLYFAIFKFPLTKEEAITFCHFKTNAIDDELNFLIEKKLIFKFDNHYTTSNKEEWFERRKIGSLKATKVLKKAKFVSRFINQFPFVEAVFLSGSISKGYFGEDDDIDFFIITSPNRLWLTRTFLILFKKIFLLNSKKYFCINYLVSINSLEINEKNRFTATEFATLLPMTGNGIHKDFELKNPWVTDFLPNYTNTKELTVEIKKNIFRRTSELFLKGNIGDKLDKKFMKITKNHQKKKFNKLKKKDFDLAFKGSENESKHHPDNHQVRIINLLNDKITAFNKEYKLSIPLEND